MHPILIVDTNQSRGLLSQLAFAPQPKSSPQAPHLLCDNPELEQAWTLGFVDSLPFPAASFYAQPSDASFISLEHFTSRPRKARCSPERGTLLIH